MKNMTPEASDESWAKQAIIAMLEGHLGHLRSIKDMELAWLDRYSVLTLPIIGLLLAYDPSQMPFSARFLVIIVLAYLAITIWMQDVLRKERRSYYRVLRQVIRAQNYLGLFDIGFLPETMSDAAFPKGLGPNPARDGTQPYASFLRRQVYVFIIYSAIIVGAIYQNSALLPSIG